MNLYIQIDNGQPINHPAFEDNLIEAFGLIPENWEPFIRVERPKPKTYEVFVNMNPTYQKIDGVWTDVWSLRDMTDEEKASKQQAVKDDFNSKPYANNFSSWTFDETICEYVPPVPLPTNPPPIGQVYFWQGGTDSWQLVPKIPTDGKKYEWNFTSWSWEEIIN